MMTTIKCNNCNEVFSDEQDHVCNQRESVPLLTGKGSVANQGNFEIRITSLEQRLKAVEEKLKAIVRIDVKPTELMKLSKEDRSEIFEWGALTAENAELKKRIDELESERRENALDGQAELDILGIENAELVDSLKEKETELEKYKRLVKSYQEVITLARTKGLVTVAEYYWHKWDEYKQEAGI